MNLNDVFNNKTVLITGHTGFKGSWLSLWLTHLGSNVVGVSIDVPSNPSFDASEIYSCVDDRRLDIRKSEMVKVVYDVQPDFIFHLGASLGKPSYELPVEQ